MERNTKTIIYDDTCPLCAAYTKAFVKAGLIEKTNRKSFSNIDPHLLSLIDTKRCVNEIPVLDLQTQQVWYGVDGLTEILYPKLPFIKTLVNIKPIRWFLYKLYKLISYNRRVIVAPKKPNAVFDCTPDFNATYRILLMVTILIINTIMLFPIQEHVLSNSWVKHRSILQLQLAHFLLVAVNICITIILKKRKGLEYLGQANMLAFTTVLLTVPLLFYNKMINFYNETINNIYLLLITLFIIKEYVRRMKSIKIINIHKWIIVINIISITTFLGYLIFNNE